MRNCDTVTVCVCVCVCVCVNVCVSIRILDHISLIRSQHANMSSIVNFLPLRSAVCVCVCAHARVRVCMRHILLRVKCLHKISETYWAVTFHRRALERSL